MFCKKCGTAMDPDAAFCINCGTPIERPVPAAPISAPPSPPASTSGLKVSRQFGFASAQDLPQDPIHPVSGGYSPGYPSAPVYTPDPAKAPPYEYIPAPEPPAAPPYTPADRYTPPPTYTPVHTYMPVELKEPASGYVPGPGEKAASPDKNKKIILFSAIGGAVLVITVILLLILGGSAGFSSAEEAAEAFVMAKITGNGEDYVNCLHDFYIRRLGEEYGMDKHISRDEMAEILEETLFKQPSCKIESSKIVSYAAESDYNYIKQRKGYFRYLTDAEYDTIGDVVRIEVIYTVDGSQYHTSVICIEMGGRWYPYP